jgi:hypothetical protein
VRRRHLLWLTATALVLALCAAGCASSSTTSSTPSAGATGTGSGSTSSTSSGTATTTTSSGPASRGGPSALTVSPTTGSPHTVIHFSFTSPGGTGDASTQLSQSLSVVGPHGGGCVGMHDQPVPMAPAGQTVSASVGPAQLGGAWCPGTYAARVEVLARPKCGQGMMCPQFIRVVAVLGPATFTITH